MRALALMLWLVWLPAAQAAGGTVHEFELDNGLQILVKADHRAPVVVSQIWYKVGASYERAGHTGISHVLEHMMFKGTEAHPAGEFSRIISRHGGQENAFTGRDYTAYFQKLAERHLEVSLRLEADRMRNLLLEPEEFGKEIQVVMEERRLRTEDQPRSLTHEHFNAIAHPAAPYGQPVIGWMDDLRHMSVEDLRAWYRRWYAPNNATLVVVGDVDPEAVRRLAEEHFGPLEPSTLEPLDRRPTLTQRGPRRITVRAPAELPYLIMGYKVPVLATAAKPWEAYALEVLAGVLDGGDSARLPRRLVRGTEVAASAGASYDLYARLDSVLGLDGTPAPGKTLEAVERALREEVRRLRAEPVAAEELERVKAQVVADDVFQRDSMFYQALEIGMLETVGLGWEVMDRYVERIRAVTAEQVQEVARKYLTDGRLTVAVLEPQPVEGRARRPADAAEVGGPSPIH